MKLAIFLLACVSAHAALTADVTMGADQAQQFLRIRGKSGTCTILVSLNPSLSPVINDVNGTEYTGANTDVGRLAGSGNPIADGWTQSDGSEILPIGHNFADMALSPNTAYYYSVSGCGTTVTGTFVTTPMGNGNSIQYPTPFDSTKPYNLSVPQQSLPTCAPVNDPVTGNTLTPEGCGSERTWRTGAPGTYPIPAVTGQYNTLGNYYAGGTGWTGTIIGSPTSSNATTGNTNTLYLYGAGGEQFVAPFMGGSEDDLGLVLGDSATNRNGTDNVISVCVFWHPSDGCVGTPFTVTITNSSFGPDTNGSANDPDNAYPTNFPTFGGTGWGLTTGLPSDHQGVYGTAACTAGACVITSPSVQGNYDTTNGFFPYGMKAGDRIWVNGSDPTCTNNLCTVATYTDQTHITISESLTRTDSFRTFGWGIQVYKTTATGSVTLGVAYKVAGSLGIGQGSANGWNCNSHQFTTGNGHIGFLCVTPSISNRGSSNLYGVDFYSADGTVIPLYAGRIQPTSSTCFLSGTASADLPNGAAVTWNRLWPGEVSTRFYVGQSTNSGAFSLFRLDYTGDGTENLHGNAYAGNLPNFAFPAITSPDPCGYWRVTNLTLDSTGHSVSGLVQANVAYSGNTCGVSLCGGFTWAYYGQTGNYAVFNQQWSNGQGNPGWVATFDVTTSPATLVKLINTLDGTGTGNAVRGCNSHNASAAQAGTNIILRIACDALTANNNTLAGGPLEINVIAKLGNDCVTWNANTSLPWPEDGSYCNTGPSNPYAYLGAYGSNFVTLKLSVPDICNLSPGTGEIAAYGACGFGSGYSKVLSMAAGDMFIDASDLSSEAFRLVAPCTAVSGGVSCTFQRNAATDYNCQFTAYNIGYATSNNKCVDSTGQFQHLNSWVPQMVPNRISGPNQGLMSIDLISGTIQECGKTLCGSHGGIVPASGSSVSWIEEGAVRPNVLYANVFAQPLVYSTMAGPTFNGVSSLNNLQSYITASGGGVATDGNAYNENVGTYPELGSNSFGSITQVAVGGCTNAYTITALTGSGLMLTSANYKLWPLIGGAGRYLLHDISGLSSNICGNAASAAAWGMCYAYSANECVGAAARVGTVYVNVPNAMNTGAALVGQSFLLQPVVTWGYPSGGCVRQQQITGPDPAGRFSRMLSCLLGNPTTDYPYYQFQPAPDNSFGVATAHNAQNWNTQAWIVKLPQYSTDGIDRTHTVPFTVQIGPGLAYARVDFGYSRYVGPGNALASYFWCTPRQDNCVAGTNVSPFAFASESYTTSNTYASGTGAITIPTMAGNCGTYRVDRSSDGMSWTAGETQPFCVP